MMSSFYLSLPIPFQDFHDLTSFSFIVRQSQFVLDPLLAQVTPLDRKITDPFEERVGLENVQEIIN